MVLQNDGKSLKPAWPTAGTSSIKGPVMAAFMDVSSTVCKQSEAYFSNGLAMVTNTDISVDKLETGHHLQLSNGFLLLILPTLKPLTWSSRMVSNIISLQPFTIGVDSTTFYHRSGLT